MPAKTTYNRVYQFKITLNEILPSIWRRIQVPETYSFWDLHVAIQDAMGWHDSHLHEFQIPDPKNDDLQKMGIPEEGSGGFSDEELAAGWKLNIADYFTEDNTIADYLYDFGDCWDHTVELEQILPREPKRKYPACIAGERACPPEDCGGVYGYQDFLEIIMNPVHEAYEETLDWVGGQFRPEHFVPESIKFDNPQKRFDDAFQS